MIFSLCYEEVQPVIPRVIIFWKKPSHRISKTLNPPKLVAKKNMFVIDVLITLKPYVEVVWFGCQVGVCVKKWHIDTIFGCSWFQKFNLDCWLQKLLICSPTSQNIFNFLCPSWTIVIDRDFRKSNVFHPLFGLESQSVMLGQIFRKKYFSGHCSFTKLFLSSWNLLKKNLKYLQWSYNI